MTDNLYLDQNRLHALQLMLCSNLDELLASLDIRLYRSKKMFTGRCPIHNGDNVSALNLYRNGDVRPGYWKCNTKGCHRKKEQGGFGSTILGFVRGVLSSQKYGWVGPESTKRASWKETVDYCCEFLGVALSDIKVDTDELTKVAFANEVGVLNKMPVQSQKGLLRATVRKHLLFPAQYYVDRGVDPKILDRFDVGTYPLAGRPLSGRVCVPVYDNDYRVCVGFTARSIYEQCEACERWHNPEEVCPSCEADIKSASKWRNDFNKDQYLYGYWLAKKHILESRIVVICEGPGDVWALNAAGIPMAVALFGVTMSDQQQVQLEMSGASNAVILTDSDKAGNEARDGLRRRLGNIMRISEPKVSRKDIGECSIDEIEKEVWPVIRQIQARGY